MPGIYTAAAALGLTGKLILNANNNNAAEWTFTIGGAFTTTAANSEIEITNGAGTVKWIVTGAISLGASTKAIGNIMESAGAITIGAGATCGPLKAAAAITLGAGAIIETIDAGAATTLGAGIVCAKFGFQLDAVKGCE